MRMDALVQRIIVVLAMGVAMLVCFAWCEHEEVQGLAANMETLQAERMADATEHAAMLDALRVETTQQKNALLEQEARFSALRTAIAAQDTRITTLGDRVAALEQHLPHIRQQDVGIKAAQTEVDEVRAMVMGVRQDFMRLTSDDVSAREKVMILQDTVSTVTAKLPPQRDTAAMYREMVAPTVQITCDREVGSGTIIASRPRADGGYDTYVLTALHVIEGAVGKINTAIVVTIFHKGTGATRDIEANLFAYKTPIDLAILTVRSRDRFPLVACLAPRATLSTVDIFARVYAVGCPLGYPPLPTAGELSSKTKVLVGETYWMLNAPTIFGNSGGGIYLADTGELIGILSRVSAYNNFVNIAVPHMGIFIPGTTILDWMDENGTRFLYDPNAVQEEPQPTGK